MCRFNGDHSLLWNYLARVTSLTHLSLPYLQLGDSPPSWPRLIFPFQALQYLHIHVAFAPLFANKPLKVLRIATGVRDHRQAMVKVRQHWQCTVFPHVECMETIYEFKEISIEFWREFLSNVNEVRYR